MGVLAGWAETPVAVGGLISSGLAVAVAVSVFELANGLLLA